MQNRVIRARQFKLPLDEHLLNHTYNIPGILILEDKVFQDRAGDLVVFLKWEQFEQRPEEDIFGD